MPGLRSSHQGSHAGVLFCINIGAMSYQYTCNFGMAFI